MLKKIIRKILPAGSKQRIFAGRVKSVVLYRTHSNVFIYKNWIKRIEPNLLSPILEDQSTKISIVVPCFNTPERYIRELTSSLVKQTYKNWELCIADGSVNTKTSEVIESYSKRDNRIIYIKIGKNLKIAGNTNAGLEHATGEYVAFLDHDDILPYWSINELVNSIKENPGGDIFYSDEDRLSENGKVRMSPLFKPDWSPELFFCTNYIAHFFVIKNKLLKELNGLRAKFEGAQDYDLALRSLDHNPKIVHIPKILYHMRMARSSTASAINIKTYAHDNGNLAIEDYFKRNRIKAKVSNIPDRLTNYHIKYEIVGKPLVSIIIPFKDKPSLLKTCVKSILSKTTYLNYEIVLVSNNSTEKETLSYLNEIKKNKNIKVFVYNKPFNYSAVNNFGRTKAEGKVLVFLNNDTKVINSDWLEELTATALRKEIGEVGALLFYPDKLIQHAGVIVGMLGTAGHVFRGLKYGTLTPFWLPDWPRNYLAVTAACVAIEASKFDKVGGFDEEFITAGSDVRLGLALYEAGYRNVYWPFAKLIHYENISVGQYNKRSDNRHDYDVSMKYYSSYIERGDPYYNSNLDIMSEIPVLRRR